MNKSTKSMPGGKLREIEGNSENPKPRSATIKIILFSWKNRMMMIS